MAGRLDGILPEPPPGDPWIEAPPKRSARWLAIFPAIIAVWIFVPFCVAVLQGKETPADCEVTITEYRDYKSRRQYVRRVSCSYFAEGQTRSFSPWAYSKPAGRFTTIVRYVEGKADWMAAPEFIGEGFAWAFVWVLAALFWWSWSDTFSALLGHMSRPRRG